MFCSGAAVAYAGEAVETRIPYAKDRIQYCADVAASAEAIRLDRRRNELAALEGEIGARLSLLDSKQRELRIVLEKLEAFERKTSEALVGLYTRMKPEAAAAQLAQLDAEVAAALMLHMKASASSAILGEMDASHGAALAKKISELRLSKDRKN